MGLKKIGIVLATILLAGGLGGCMRESAKDRIVNYLEEKYNESFIMENFNGGSSLSNPDGVYEAILHVEGNDNLVFTAYTTNKKEEYYDNYYLSKFADDLNYNFKATIEDNIGNNCDYKVALYSSGKYDYQDLMNMTAEEYLNYDKENIRLSLELGIQIDSNEDVSNYYDGIYKVLEYIKSYNTRRYSMSIGFVEDINDTKIKEYLRLANATEATWEDINAKVYGEMFPTYINDINSVEDLENLYIKLEE